MKRGDSSSSNDKDNKDNNKRRKRDIFNSIITLFCFSIILGLVYVEQQSYVYTTSNKAIMLAIQKDNLKLINISTQIWDWLSDVTTSIGGKSITSINTNCAYYPYNSQTITIDNKIYSLENPFLQTDSCSSGNIDFVTGSDEVVYLTGNHQLLAFGLFTQRGGQRYPIKNSIKNYKQSILKVKTNRHERLNPLVDDKIVEICEVNWANTSTTTTNYCLNMDAFQNQAGTTLAWDGLKIDGKYAFNDGSSAVIISQELSTDPITLYPCYTYRDELQPTLIPTISPTFSIKRVLSMNSLLNISGITSTSFDLPAQTAFIKTISFILGIDQTNVIITKIIDYIIPFRRLNSKLNNNENNKIESRIFLQDTKTEISFKINAVTETLGYSDPNEMSSSFQSKLSTSIQNSTFVDTFISECVNEGSNQITSSTSIECSIPIYDNITVVVVSTNLPTSQPTQSPTLKKTSSPTNSGTQNPTKSPSSSPTNGEMNSPPTNSPTNSGTQNPSSNEMNSPPTNSPTNSGTQNPTKSPSSSPTNGEMNPPPTNSPTNSGTQNPTKSPTLNPTLKTTNSPTQKPSLSPTNTPLMSPPSPGALSLPQLRSRLVDAKKFVNNQNIKRRYLRHSDYIKKQNIKSNLTLNSPTLISNNNNYNNNNERYTLLPGNTSSSNSLNSMKLSNCKSIWLSSGYDVRVSCYELLITQPTPSLGYLARASYNYDSVLNLYNTLFGCDQLIEQSTDQIKRFYIHSPTALESTLDDGYSHGVFISTDNQQAWTLQSTSDILQLKAHNFIDDSTLGINVYFITRSLGSKQLFYTMNCVTLSAQVDGTIQSEISTIFVPIIMYYYGYQGYPWIFHTAFILEVILAIILGLFTIRETFQLITYRIIPLIKWIYNFKSSSNNNNNNNNNVSHNDNTNNSNVKQNNSIKRQKSISERISGRLRHVDSIINGDEELEKNQLYIMLNEKYESDGKVYHDILDWITIIIILIRFLYRIRYIEKAHNLHTFLISLEAENSFNTRLKSIVQQFQDIESLESTFRLLSIMVIFVGTFQFFRYISFDPRCRIIITTLNASFSGLIPVLVIFLAILTAYAILASGLYGIQIPEYNTFQNSVAALFVMLLGDWSYYDLLKVSTIETQIFFWSFMILISFILFNMVIAIIFTTYEQIFEITQLERMKNQDKEN